MVSANDILQKIRRKQKPQTTFFLGIDGPGGSGKTTLSEGLRDLDPMIQVVHMDDFDLPTNGKLAGSPWEKEVGQDTDWQRLKKEVITPLRHKKEANYSPFDRETEIFGSLKRIVPGGIIVIEGVFALREELFATYDYSIWLTGDTEARLERVLRRDGEGMRRRWEEDWLPMEEKYFQLQRPDLKASLVLDTDKFIFKT